MCHPEPLPTRAAQTSLHWALGDPHVAAGNPRSRELFHPPNGHLGYLRLNSEAQQNSLQTACSHKQTTGRTVPTLGKQAGKSLRKDWEKGACKLAESLSQSTAAKKRGK